MKNLAIAMFIFICLLSFIVGLHKMVGLSWREAIGSTINPFYVMPVGEMIAFCVLIAMLLVRPFLDFRHKRKEKK